MRNDSIQLIIQQCPKMTGFSFELHDVPYTSEEIVAKMLDFQVLLNITYIFVNQSLNGMVLFNVKKSVSQVQSYINTMLKSFEIGKSQNFIINIEELGVSDVQDSLIKMRIDEEIFTEWYQTESRLGNSESGDSDNTFNSHHCFIFRKLDENISYAQFFQKITNFTKFQNVLYLLTTKRNEGLLFVQQEIPLPVMTSYLSLLCKLCHQPSSGVYSSSVPSENGIQVNGIEWNELTYNSFLHSISDYKTNDEDDLLEYGTLPPPPSILTPTTTTTTDAYYPSFQSSRTSYDNSFHIFQFQIKHFNVPMSAFLPYIQTTFSNNIQSIYLGRNGHGILALHPQKTETVSSIEGKLNQVLQDMLRHHTEAYLTGDVSVTGIPFQEEQYEESSQKEGSSFNFIKEKKREIFELNDGVVMEWRFPVHLSEQCSSQVDPNAVQDTETPPKINSDPHSYCSMVGARAVREAHTHIDENSPHIVNDDVDDDDDNKRKGPVSKANVASEDEKMPVHRDGDGSEHSYPPSVPPSVPLHVTVPTPAPSQPVTSQRESLQMVQTEAPHPIMKSVAHNKVSQLSIPIYMSNSGVRVRRDAVVYSYGDKKIYLLENPDRLITRNRYLPPAVTPSIRELSSVSSVSLDVGCSISFSFQIHNCFIPYPEVFMRLHVLLKHRCITARYLLVVPVIQTSSSPFPTAINNNLPTGENDNQSSNIPSNGVRDDSGYDSQGYICLDPSQVKQTPITTSQFLNHLQTILNASVSTDKFQPTVISVTAWDEATLIAQADSQPSISLLSPLSTVTVGIATSPHLSDINVPVFLRLFDSENPIEFLEKYLNDSHRGSLCVLKYGRTPVVHNNNIYFPWQDLHQSIFSFQINEEADDGYRSDNSPSTDGSPISVEDAIREDDVLTDFAMRQLFNQLQNSLRFFKLKYLLLGSNKRGFLSATRGVTEEVLRCCLYATLATLLLHQFSGSVTQLIETDINVKIRVKAYEHQTSDSTVGIEEDPIQIQKKIRSGRYLELGKFIRSATTQVKIKEARTNITTRSTTKDMKHSSTLSNIREEHLKVRDASRRIRVETIETTTSNAPMSLETDGGFVDSTADPSTDSIVDTMKDQPEDSLSVVPKDLVACPIPLLESVDAVQVPIGAVLEAPVVANNARRRGRPRKDKSLDGDINEKMIRDISNNDVILADNTVSQDHLSPLETSTNSRLSTLDDTGSFRPFFNRINVGTERRVNDALYAIQRSKGGVNSSRVGDEFQAVVPEFMAMDKRTKLNPQDTFNPSLETSWNVPVSKKKSILKFQAKVEEYLKIVKKLSFSRGLEVGNLYVIRSKYLIRYVHNQSLASNTTTTTYPINVREILNSSNIASSQDNTVLRRALTHPTQVDTIKGCLSNAINPVGKPTIGNDIKGGEVLHKDTLTHVVSTSLLNGINGDGERCDDVAKQKMLSKVEDTVTDSSVPLQPQSFQGNKNPSDEHNRQIKSSQGDSSGDRIRWVCLVSFDESLKNAVASGGHHSGVGGDLSDSSVVVFDGNMLFTVDDVDHFELADDGAVEEIALKVLHNSDYDIDQALQSIRKNFEYLHRNTCTYSLLSNINNDMLFRCAIMIIRHGGDTKKIYPKLQEELSYSTLVNIFHRFQIQFSNKRTARVLLKVLRLSKDLKEWQNLTSSASTTPMFKRALSKSELLSRIYNSTCSKDDSNHRDDSNDSDDDEGNQSDDPYSSKEGTVTDFIYRLLDSSKLDIALTTKKRGRPATKRKLTMNTENDIPKKKRGRPRKDSIFPLQQRSATDDNNDEVDGDDDDDDDDSNVTDSPCVVCGLNDAPLDAGDILIICDGCDHPHHLHCVGLNEVPSEDWYCMDCNSERVSRTCNGHSTSKEANGDRGGVQQQQMMMVVMSVPMIENETREEKGMRSRLLSRLQLLESVVQRLPNNLYQQFLGLFVPLFITIPDVHVHINERSSAVVKLQELLQDYPKLLMKFSSVLQEYHSN